MQKIFDQIYEIVKGILLPRLKKDQSASPSPTSNTNTGSTNTQNKSLVENVVLPVAKPVGNPNLAQTILSPEEQRALLSERRKTPLWIHFLKYISLVVIVSGMVSFLWFKIDLEPENKYLSVFGLSENGGLKFENSQKRKSVLERDLSEYSGKITRFSQQLEQKKYSVYTDVINEIKSQQLAWFDRVNSDGTEVYGILDGPARMEAYFNSKAFDHPILSSTGNKVMIEGVAASRDGVDFQVSTSHLFGKVFFLSYEFVKMMNSFPIYKNGELATSLNKQKDSNGNEGMKFSLKLQIQRPGEIDPEDVLFQKYEKWITSSR